MTNVNLDFGLGQLYAIAVLLFRPHSIPESLPLFDLRGGNWKASVANWLVEWLADMHTWKHFPTPLTRALASPSPHSPRPLNSGILVTASWVVTPNEIVLPCHNLKWAINAANGKCSCQKKKKINQAGYLLYAINNNAIPIILSILSLHLLLKDTKKQLRIIQPSCSAKNPIHSSTSAAGQNICSTLVCLRGHIFPSSPAKAMKTLNLSHTHKQKQSNAQQRWLI